MTTAQDLDTPLTEELYASTPPQYLPALRSMLALVPRARTQFGRGNVVTAFRLLNEARNVKISPKWNMTKEQVLNYVLAALPTEYQVGDIDPDDE